MSPEGFFPVVVVVFVVVVVVVVVVVAVVVVVEDFGMKEKEELEDAMIATFPILKSAQREVCLDRGLVELCDPDC